MLRSLVFILCLATAAVGVGLIFVPAGLIAAGALGAGALVADARGRA